MQISVRTVLGGLGVQLTMGLVVMRWQGGNDAIAWVARLVTTFLEFGLVGAEFVFGESLWDHAFAWALDRAPDATPEPPRTDLEVPSSDDPEEIAAELGLASFSTRDELQRARRRFMWRNHPDRKPELPAALANRRVAIANMLIDRALRGLSSGGRSS